MLRAWEVRRGAQVRTFARRCEHVMVCAASGADCLLACVSYEALHDLGVYWLGRVSVGERGGRSHDRHCLCEVGRVALMKSRPPWYCTVSVAHGGSARAAGDQPVINMRLRRIGCRSSLSPSPESGSIGWPLCDVIDLAPAAAAEEVPVLIGFVVSCSVDARVR